jgi:hypothetical protein
MNSICSLKTLVNLYQTTRRHVVALGQNYRSVASEALAFAVEQLHKSHGSTRVIGPPMPRVFWGEVRHAAHAATLFC